MVQNLSLVVAGVNVTSSMVTCNISKEMNRIYNTASIKLGYKPTLDDTVVITYADDTFTGFVYAIDKSSKSTYTVTCRTNSAKLTEPYSISDNVLETETTSHTLCTQYANDAGVSINITTEDIDFKGSFERSGTKLSALVNLANITGAEYWDDEGIYIAPNKAITTDGTFVDDSDYFNFAVVSESVDNNSLGFITISNGGSEIIYDSIENVVSRNNLSLEIFEATGEVLIFPNPNGVLDYVTGISDLKDVLINKREVFSLDGALQVTTDAAIYSVENIALNGVNITDYSFTQGHNVIYFDEPKTGYMVVDYTAYAQKGMLDIAINEGEAAIDYKIAYRDQLLEDKRVIDYNNQPNTIGDIVVIMPDDMNYVSGIGFWVIGDAEVALTNNGEDIVGATITSTEQSYTVVEDATLLRNAAGDHFHILAYDADSVNSVKCSGTTMPYTLSTVNGRDRVTISEYCPNLVVSYETTATLWEVSADAQDGYVVLSVSDGNGSLQEYPLSTPNFTIVCGLPMDIPVVIHDELGVIADSAVGKTIPFYNSVGAPLATYTADKQGIIVATVTEDGSYKLDTDSVLPKSYLILKVNTGA